MNSRKNDIGPDFKTGEESPEGARPGRFSRIAWIPIPLLAAAIIIARLAGLRESYPSQALTLVLSFCFYTLVSLGTILLIGRNFLKSGAPGLLLLDCGVILWCLAGTVGDAVSKGDANINVTIFNTAILLAGLCHLGGAALSLQPRRPLNARPLWLAAGGVIVLGALYVITRGAMAGWLPVFFVPEQGGTLVRQTVLISAIMVFMISSGLVLASRRGHRTPFASWYGMALLLLAVGLFGVMIQLSLGSVVNWLGRAAQWLGGLYLFLAAILHESNLPLFRPEKEPRPELYRYGVAVAIVLAAVAVRLTFLPALGTRYTFVTLFPAVTLAALHGGLGPGLLATILSGLAAGYFWIEPQGRFSIADPGDWVGLLFFAVSSLMICVIVEAMHKARSRLVFQQDHLEELVKDRTHELEREMAERKEAEQALRESEGMLSRAEKMADVGSWEWDIGSGKVRWSDQIYRIFGVEAGSFIPTYDSFLSFIHRDDREQVTHAINDALSGGGPHDMEYRIVRPDLSTCWIYGKGEVAFDKDGRPRRMFGAVLDITDRKEAESRLEGDFAALTMIHALSGKLVAGGKIGPLLQEIMDAAVSIASAQKGTLQLVESESLKIVAHHGHGQPFLEFFAAAENRASVCGEATRRGERVVVPDVETSTLFAGTPSLDTLRRAGVRAVQSTPITARSGELLGILTTQWSAPHQPDERDLWRIDLLARQAADLIESSRASEELRNSERREKERADELAALFRAVPTPVFIAHSPECRHISGNPAAEDLLRMPSGGEASLEAPLAIKPRNYRILKDGRELSNEELPAQLAARGSEVRDFEFTIAFDDGTARHVVGYGTPLKGEDGWPRGGVLAVVDITERKEAEEALRLNNEILEGINRVLNAALTSGSEEELGTACLEVAERITGSRFGFIGEINPAGLEDIAISNPGWDACTIVDAGGHRRPPGNFRIHGLYGRVLSDGKALFTNDPGCHPDRIGLPEGHPPLESFLGVPLIRDGKTIGMIAVANREGGYRAKEQETLEALAPAMVEAFLRKRAEQELRKAHDELERRVEERTREVRRQADLLDLAHDAIIVRQLDGRIIFWNRGAEEIYGFTRDEALGRITHELLRTEFPLSIEVITDTVLREGKWEGELVHTGKRGQVTVFSRWTLRRSGPDKAAEILEINLDITQRKIAEEQLRQAHKLEAIGTLAGGIAHDFNNILAAILGFTEMAIDDVEDRPLVGKNLRHVMKSAMRARELVKQILTFSRRASHDRSPLALTPVIRETVQLLRATIPATVDIRVSLRSTADLVLAAPVEIQQILMNLATNASLAMQERGGTMEISLADTDFEPDLKDAAPDEYVKITVRDTGCGMSPEVVKRIFEPFYTTREVGKGSGMGLAVVYGVVKDLQGTITVESEEGVGSTFRVLLPRVETDARTERMKPSEVTGGKERILFVDDEEMLAEWGKTTLERLGYRVTAVTDSRQALKAFSNDPMGFDLVITDHAMPGMAGSELSMEILRIRSDIPIILCTGHTEMLTAESARDMGIREFLLKPLARQELAGTVRRVLDQTAA